MSCINVHDYKFILSIKAFLRVVCILEYIEKSGVSLILVFSEAHCIYIGWINYIYWADKTTLMETPTKGALMKTGLYIHDRRVHPPTRWQQVNY